MNRAENTVTYICNDAIISMKTFTHNSASTCYLSLYKAFRFVHIFSSSSVVKIIFKKNYDNLKFYNFPAFIQIAVDFFLVEGNVEYIIYKCCIIWVSREYFFLHFLLSNAFNWLKNPCHVSWLKLWINCWESQHWTCIN